MPGPVRPWSFRGSRGHRLAGLGYHDDRGPVRPWSFRGSRGGKSRLVAETKDLKGSRGWQVLQGYCFDSDCSFPHAPLVDLLCVFLNHINQAELSATLGSHALKVKDSYNLTPTLFLFQNIK